MNDFNDFQEYSDGLVEAFDITLDYIMTIFPNERRFFHTFKNQLDTRFFLSHKQAHLVLTKILEINEDSVANEPALLAARATLFKNPNRFSREDRIKIQNKVRKIENLL